MALTKEELKQLAVEVGAQAAGEIKTQVDALDLKLNTKYDEMLKGTVSAEDFKAFKDSCTNSLNETLAKIKDISEANKAQAEKITGLLEGPKKGESKTMEDVLRPLMPQLRELKKKGTGYIELTGADLKAAGVQSIGGSIVPESPYLPGISNTALELFDIVRAPNFMITRVDMGQTDQYKLAWVNETGMEGAIETAIAESGVKPQVQYKFSVEISTALKAAAWSALTEEFDTDVPGLASEVRGMLQRDVIHAFDNAIQEFVFSVAKPYNLPGLVDDIMYANLWDAAYALITQVGVYEFDPNTLAIHWITNAKIQMSKNQNGSYLNPPFGDELKAMLVRANKITINSALAGDLKQVRVRMYQDYSLRMGWINDQFIKNEFAILGELRYHRFISDNRKWALAKGDLNAIKAVIDGVPGS